MDADEQALWREADRVLDELLDLPATERLPRLQHMPLPPALRERVTRLLTVHARPDGPLDAASLREFIADVAIATAPPADLRGQRLGRWRLIEAIGRGGMAVVYRAASCEAPLDQQAAVKLLTLGALARGGSERFLREQRLLARLRHPYIASLYDAGVAADGTPWLAMELVEGERIDEWCRHRQADLDARVGLALQVAEALAYAHRNMVIHRDIKPSNVLIDDGGHVRLLDFGIGALIDDENAERTASGLAALTPEYAAPEQFTGAAPTTAMDVFGLGGLLYRLFSGQPPVRDGAGGTTTLPPARAAARAVTSGQPHPWAGRLRGDLDANVMKALAAEPERRYASIEAFADDLRRWQSRLPVHARAPSFGYRLRRFAVRNRWGVAAGVALAVVVLAGIGATLWEAQQARTEAEHARAAAEESKAQLTYVNNLFELLLMPGTEQVQKRDIGALIRKVAEQARKDLANQNAVLATVERSLATLTTYSGDYAQGLELAESALARRRAIFGEDAPEAAEIMVSVSSLLRLTNAADNQAKALALTEQAVAILRRHAPYTPLLVETLDFLALLQTEHDDSAQGFALIDEALSICGRLGNIPECEGPLLQRAELFYRLDRFPEAIADSEKLLKLKQQRLGPDHIETLEAASLVAQSYNRAGDSAKAVSLLDEILAKQRQIYDKPTIQILNTQQFLIEALVETGDYPRAERESRELIEQARATFGENNAQFAFGYGELGDIAYHMGRYQEAADDYQRDQASNAALAGADSPGAMIPLLNYANALREQGRAKEALPLQQRALPILEQAIGPESSTVAGNLNQLAITELALGDAAAALAYEDRALAIDRAQSANTPFPAGDAANRALALLQLKRIDDARETARAALAEIETKTGIRPLYYGQVLAAYERVMCANPPLAPDCADARHRVEAELSRTDLAGHARNLLTAAHSQTAAAAR
jgi:serine/threonine-protein kinase